MELKTNTLFTDASLVGYWRLNGDGNDSSPNGLNGTVTGASSVAAKFGNGYSFAGGTNSIAITDGSSLLDLSTFTISLWLKVTGTVSGALFCNYDRGPEYGYIFGLASSLLNITSYNNAPVAGLNSNIQVNDGNYHHCCALRDNSDNGRFSLYIDGVLDNTVASSGTIGFNAGVLPFIGNRETNDYGVSGTTIDDVSVFSRVLTAVEIRSMYSDGGFFAFL